MKVKHAKISRAKICWITVPCYVCIFAAEFINDDRFKYFNDEGDLLEVYTDGQCFWTTITASSSNLPFICRFFPY